MNIRKERNGALCDKIISVYIPLERIVELQTMQEQGGYPSMSALIRRIVAGRRVMTKREDNTLDTLMWMLCGIRTDLCLWELKIAEIRKGIGRFTWSPEDVPAIEQAETLFRQVEVQVPGLFNIISKLGQVWLQE